MSTTPEPVLLAILLRMKLATIPRLFQLSLSENIAVGHGAFDEQDLQRASLLIDRILAASLVNRTRNAQRLPAFSAIEINRRPCCSQRSLWRNLRLPKTASLGLPSVHRADL